MSLREIVVAPNRDTSHFRTTILLPSFRLVNGAFAIQNERWTFDFYTNTADNAWYWDVENDNASIIVNGQPVANGVDLFLKFRHLNLPTGQLFVQDKSLLGADPDIAAFFDGRASLYYYEPNDV